MSLCGQGRRSYSNIGGARFQGCAMGPPRGTMDSPRGTMEPPRGAMEPPRGAMYPPRGAKIGIVYCIYQRTENFKSFSRCAKSFC